jgi:hypothetical protein
MRFKLRRMRRARVFGGVVLAAAGLAFGVPAAEAAVHVGIGLGLPPVAAPPVVVAPPPVAYAAPPVVVAPRVYGWGGVGYGHDWHRWDHRDHWDHDGHWHRGR